MVSGVNWKGDVISLGRAGDSLCKKLKVYGSITTQFISLLLCHVHSSNITSSNYNFINLKTNKCTITFSSYITVTLILSRPNPSIALIVQLALHRTSYIVVTTSLPPNGMRHPFLLACTFPGVNDSWYLALPINNCSPVDVCPPGIANGGTFPFVAGTHRKPLEHKTSIF